MLPSCPWHQRRRCEWERQIQSARQIYSLMDVTSVYWGIRYLCCSHRKTAWRDAVNRTLAILALQILLIVASSRPAFAQQPEGPQTSAPAAVGPEVRPAGERRAGTGDKITVPAGTRVAVVLENGISTRSAKAGDSLYFRTSFPITQNNHVIVPVGSYLRGELLESNAAPRSADSGGKETMDPEGKVTGEGGKGKDVGTVATTTVTGAGIGAIAGGGKGAGIGAGIGGLAGLGAILLTRGPDAQLPRGSTLDIVLEHALMLDSDQIQYRHVGDSSPITPPPSRPE